MVLVQEVVLLQPIEVLVEEVVVVATEMVEMVVVAL